MDIEQHKLTSKNNFIINIVQSLGIAMGSLVELLPFKFL